MRALIQRVSRGQVISEGQLLGEIGLGMLILLGIHKDDTKEDARWLAEKVFKLRIFSDETGKMNCNISQAGGEFLVVSQFTLYASCLKGNRPDFLGAAPPKMAIPLYEKFLSYLRQKNVRVATGVFGASMQISLCNEGPVTLLLDSPEKEVS